VSSAARCWWSWTSSAALVLLVAACGGSAASRIEGPFGAGAMQVWVTHAHGEPKAVVAILHGLSPTPQRLDFKRWQLHLAREGYDVIYPRYEDVSGEPRARDGVVGGVRDGLKRLGHPAAPLVLVGHSRGGRLAVEAAAYLKPREVIAIYPGTINASFEPPTDFTRIPASTIIWLVVGDRDEGVGSAGAVELFERLRTFGIPSVQIHPLVIHSTKAFTADHMSIYRTDPAAQKAVWARVDRLIRQAVGA
jgi:pimeloyl-ACP methyl ester carboxylesterase